MRTYFTFLLVIVTGLFLTGCKEENKNKLLDINAKVAINSQTGTKADGPNPKHLTDAEIVDQVSFVWFVGGYRGFGELQRDRVNNRLMMWGSDIITLEGELVDRFIISRDLVFERWSGTATNAPDFWKDTIAYIPNIVMNEAETKIRKAYNAGDYETVYSLFDKAYTFIPITGEEWRALKAAGIE